MSKQPLYDLVILLPGILGSVLSDDTGDIWAPSGQAVWSAMTRRLDISQRLILRGDEGADCDQAGDGLRATRLVWDVHLIPGFMKIDGYSATAQMIRDEFDVTEGTMPVTHPANFYQMPYDWRRDNRFNAYQLQRLIDHALLAWRQHSGVLDAKVIIIAHSMGGLIARYYLEVLEGWRDCKALITFGTPYRGSLNALNFLANGYKKLFLDLSDAMRSMPSAYQLMPIYPVVNVGGIFGRVAETPGIPGIDPELASDALRFHREIEEAVTRHRKDANYWEFGYRILPFVGVQQPTLQSARLDNGKLSAAMELPKEIDSWFFSGDGTVPHVSAVPIEMSQAFQDTFIGERHSALQNNPVVLDALALRLTQMQVTRGKPIHGDESPADRLAFSVGMDDLYLADESVVVRVGIGIAGIQGAERGNDVADLPNTVSHVTAKITRLERSESGSSNSVEILRELQRDSEEQWTLIEEGLLPGLYRLEVKARMTGSRQAPTPVHDLFEVV